MPSGTDEQTFDRCFGTPDWSVMFILAREGATYARLRFNVGPPTTKRLGIAVDYQREFPGTDHDVWLREYEDLVVIHDPLVGRGPLIVNREIEPWSAFRQREESLLAEGWAEP